MKYLLLLIPFFILVFFIFSKGSYVDSIWKGDITKKRPSEVQLESMGKRIKVVGFTYSHMETVSYIKYEISGTNIYISNYVKPKFINWFPKNPIYIDLANVGIYKIYYKNGDGTLDFIKELEYK